MRPRLPLAALAGVLLITMGLCLSAVTLLGVPADQTLVIACGYPAVAVFYAFWVSWSRTR